MLVMNICYCSSTACQVFLLGKMLIKNEGLIMNQLTIKYVLIIGEVTLSAGSQQILELGNIRSLYNNMHTIHKYFWGL